MANTDIIDALLRERAGYEHAGLDDRAAQVDEQLTAYGYVEPTAAAAAPEQADAAEEAASAPAPTSNTADAAEEAASAPAPTSNTADSTPRSKR